jgi:hypothetical protein
MPRVPPLRRCTSYEAGHTVHWIQALHTANKPEVARRTRRGTLVAVDGDVLMIRFAVDAEPEGFRNHEPQRLLTIARRLPTAVSLNDRYCILLVDTYCFSVRPAARGPLGQCPVDDPVDSSPEALAERTRTHGGFSVPLSPAVPTLSDPPGIVIPEV